MKLSFYPLDITYVVHDGKAVIRMFGRTTDGKQICVEDPSFEPYFTVTGTPDLKELEALKTDQFFVVRVEKAQRNVNETPTDVLRVFVNLPKAVPALKDLAKKIPEVTGVYEIDILYTRRYCIDKQLIPLVLTHVEAKQTPANLAVPCYTAQKISQEDNTLTEPKLLAVDIETYNPENKLNMKKNPILMIGLYGKNFQRVITWKKFDTDKKYIEFVPTEADALLRFVELVQQYQPDMLCGYYTDGFDFPYLLERAKIHKIPLPLGLDGSQIELFGKTEKEAKIIGIPHIDIFKFVRRVIARSLKTDSYTLDSVAKELLGEQKHAVDMEQFFKTWDAGGKELEPYCAYNLQDCKLTYDLTSKLLPTLIEFVRIIRIFPHEICRMSFSTFVEWYLINQAARHGEVILNKPGPRAESDRMHDRIKGAFVFEPKPGFYEHIAVFDYRSLYPSIIASHNISKGTLNCTCCTTGPAIDTARGNLRYCQKRTGLFSTVIFELITRRSEIKKQLKTNKDPLLAARSEALKVLANSFYGYMGFAPARWYCIECAESTTAWARHYIHQAIDTAEKTGFTVLYSDTDSVFLLLEKKTKEDALKLMDDINKKLPPPMELDFEGYYPAGIFVGLKASDAGAKKKYALLDEKGHMKIKGFETVRRNSSMIAKDVQQKVLELVLKEHDPQKAKNYVRQVVTDLRANKIPLTKVVIHTALSKGTEGYASIGPHVAAAQRMQARGQDVGKGTLIDYVVVKGKGKIRDKVKLPDETKQEDYDGEYYIQNQVLPGVERIFAVLGMNVDDLVSTTMQSSLSGF